MSPTVNPTLFFSYARGDDEAFVRRLHDDLEAAGFDAWFDRVDMPQRPLTFHQEIEDAIRERDRLIYVAGPRAAASDYVSQEWRSALGFDKHVIPLLRLGEYEDVLPGQLALMHCEDFRDDTEYQTRLTKLVESLRQPEPRLGALKAVPNLPRTLLARPLLMRRIKDALLIDLNKPVVVTGAAATADDQGNAPQQVGLQGMGGLGKSVLATAVARDREVRRAYPDGVIWITFGPKPSVAALMREFATHLECDSAFGTLAEGKGILGAFCARKALLLILDDVWSARDAEAFDILGPRSRMLVTTRDAGILRTLQGELVPVDLVSADQARQLLADNARTDEKALPQEADEIVQECGYLPLALALAGGMVAGRSGSQHAWSNVLDRLRRADLEKVRDRHAINPQHESIWRAMAASVEVLEEDQRQRFTELSVFRHDQRTPEAAVATLWGHAGGMDDLDTDDLLVEFGERSLVRLDSDQTHGRRVWLHDLLCDFATRLVDAPESLHDQLLEAYRARCPDGWSCGPNDGYFYESLGYHLLAAGRGKELEDILTDFAFLQRKIDLLGPQLLIEDYDLINEGPEESLRLIQRALRLSAYALSRDAAQLRNQLFGRLGAMRAPPTHILDLLAGLPIAKGLTLLTPTLSPPVGPLVRSVSVPAEIESLAVLPDGRSAVCSFWRHKLAGPWSESLHGMVVLDLETGSERHRLSDIARGIALCPDGRHAV